VKGEVLEIDRFGNVRLNLRPGHLERAGLSDDSELQVTTPNATAAVRRIATYSEASAGEFGILADAWSWLSIVQFEASAADGLGVERGDLVWVRRMSSDA
jgi:S-adenosylmethionine hydrolase